jgi:hypothetical protein
MMKSLTFRIEEGLHRWLESEARLLGWTKSEIVRDALEDKRKGKSRKPSLHGIMKDACVSLKGAPRDLSRNQRTYMKGFGQ